LVVAVVRDVSLQGVDIVSAVERNDCGETLSYERVSVAERSAVMEEGRGGCREMEKEEGRAKGG
jgi:hypothetical protein